MPVAPHRLLSRQAYNFKSIQAVPTAKDFIDIVLSKTQRGTPTVVHNGALLGTQQPRRVSMAAHSPVSSLARLPHHGCVFAEYKEARLNVVPGLPVPLPDTPSHLPLLWPRLAGWAIQRIRQFYMRKVKFTQQNWHDKLTQILDDFPKASPQAAGLPAPAL